MDTEEDPEVQLLTLPDDLRAVRPFISFFVTFEAVLKLVEKGKNSPEDIVQTPQIEIERIAQINHQESAKLMHHISQILYRTKPVTLAEVEKIILSLLTFSEMERPY